MTCTRLHWKTHALDRSVLEHILVVHDNLIHLPFDLSAGGAGQSPVEGLLALAEERRSRTPADEALPFICGLFRPVSARFNRGSAAGRGQRKGASCRRCL